MASSGLASRLRSRSEGALLDIGARQFRQFPDLSTYSSKTVALPHVVHTQREPFNCPNDNLRSSAHRLAESTDGVNFTRSTRPGSRRKRAPLGGPGPSMSNRSVPWIIKGRPEYKMFYSCSYKALFWRVALAVSTDARHWTKVPGKQTGGAVLDIGPAGSFDVACAYEPR